jgi:site-specific DNA recombinase
MSIESQPEVLRSWAQAQGWKVVGEITDPGKTGRNDDREGFRSLMQSLRVHRPDAVLVTRLSRFMRNARLPLNAIHEMREMGVALICKDEPIDTRQRGIADMFLAILATMAEWESDRMSEYAKQTRQRLVAKGRWPSGTTPYGYELDKESGKLVVVPEQAEVVKLIFSLYTEKRMGMNAVQRELVSRGIKAPRGGKVWSMSKVWQVLKDEVYTGRHRLGISAPPFVDEEVFNRAQKLRSTNKRLHPPRKDPWPLQNRLRCSECGSTFFCTYSRGRRYYRCSGRRQTSRHYLETGERCSAPPYRAEELEESLLTGICDSMFKPKNFARALETTIIELTSRKRELEEDIGPLQKALEEVDEEFRRLELAWIRGRLSDDELRSLERDALDRKERIQGRLESLAPDDLSEYERTQQMLEAAERSLEMAEASGDRWRFKEAPPLWFTEALAPLKEISTEVFADVEDVEGAIYDTIPPINPKHISELLSSMLDHLQAEVWSEAERLSLKGRISLTVPPSEHVPYPGVMTMPETEDGVQEFCYGSRTE